MANAFVPDEIFHTGYMWLNQYEGYFHIENFEGHGSAFWYFGGLVERIFDEPRALFVLRLLSLFSLVGAAFFVILSFKDSCQKQTQTILLFCVFILTLPFFWWDGKLIIPEFFQCFLIALSFYLIYVRKKGIAFSFLLLGFCFGLKLNAGAVVAFFVADSFFENIRVNQFKYFIRNIFLLISGFLLCNPIALINFSTFIFNIHENGLYVGSASYIDIMNQWTAKLTGERILIWDLVYFGGMDKTVIPILNVLLLFVMIVFACQQKRLRYLSVIVFIVSAIIMFTINKHFLSHHLFTTVFLIVLLATRIRNFKNKWLDGCFFVAILLNMIITVPHILEERELSRQLSENIEHANEHTQCIKAAIQGQNISFVIDNTDMGRNAEDVRFLIKKGLNLPPHTSFIQFIYATDFIENLKPEILSSFMNGKIQMLYLDGARTRKASRYANFIPELFPLLQKNEQLSHNKRGLNISYLADCLGTRVNILSVQQTGEKID